MADDFYVDLPVESGGGGGPFLPLAGGTMSGDINTAGHDILGGGRVAQGITVHTVVDGQTYTILSQWAYALLYSVSSIPTQTVILPASPIIGQTLTITSLAGGIDVLSLATSDGSTIIPTPPTSLAVGQSYQYVYVVIGGNKYWVLVDDNAPTGSFLPIAGGTLTGTVSFTPDATNDIGSPDGGSTLERPNNVYVGHSVLIDADQSSDLPVLNIGGATLTSDLSNGNVTLDSTGIGGVIKLIGAIVAGQMQINNIQVNPATGFLGLPNLTSAQKTALSALPGYTVFDTDLNKICFYGTDSAWHIVTSL